MNKTSRPDAYAEFFARYPQYRSTLHLDALRAVEYGRLDEQGHVYLDYTGASLHAASQVRQHADLLNTQALGNPHSAMTRMSSCKWPIGFLSWPGLSHIAVIRQTKPVLSCNLQRT